MSDGYTPVFQSVFRGTLHGKWPDIGLWLSLLAMADWRGEIDATTHYISAVTGLAVGEVEACIARFCAPDPQSRSQVAGGARLELIDPNRGWGWRVINIQKYRDKASGAAQVADGRNAEKVRRYRERHRGTPADTGGHPQTPTHTHTQTYTQTQTGTTSSTPISSLPKTSSFRSSGAEDGLTRNGPKSIKDLLSAKR